MASKVEILGGQLDGSVLENAASESTLRELIDAVKRLEGTTKANKPGGSKSGSNNPEIDTKDANAALDALGKGVGKGAAAVTGGLNKLSGAAGSVAGGLGKLSGAALAAAGSVAKSLGQMGGLISTGNNNLSQFAGALNTLPGPLGTFASAIASGIAVLEEYQQTQRELSKTGASFNNSMMEMRVTAARSGLSLADFAGVLKQNAESIGGLGDTITDGAKKLANVGNAVGASGLDQSFMRLGMSSTQARIAAMRFSTELVKGDRVRRASATQLASASLDYEKDLDLLAKQTGKSKDALRAFSEGLIKGGGALTFAFAKMSPQMQAAMKGIMDRVGATMGQGAQDALADIFSGAAAPSTEAAAMFQAQMPGVIAVFKQMKETSALEATNETERAAKAAKMDSLNAEVSFQQLKYLQTARGKFEMENIKKLAPAQQEFLRGLQAQAKSLSEQGIDINTASKEDIERVLAAKRAEQERQTALDKGFNAFQATITKISSAIQTTFFSILSPILEKLAGGLENLMTRFGEIGTAIEDMGIAMETITPVIDFIVDMLGITLGTAFETMAFVVSKVWDGMQALLSPIQELFAAFGILGTDTEGVTNGFKTLMDGINATYLIVRDILGGTFDFLFQIIRTFIGVVTDIVNVFTSVFQPQIQWVSSKIKDFADFISDIGPEILRGIRAFFSAEGPKAFAAGVKTMLQTATGTVLGRIADIIPDWAGGKQLAETAKGMTQAGEESRKEYTKQKDAALAQADARSAAVSKEIETKKAETAQATVNFKTNLNSGRAALAERRARERADAESAADRKNAKRDQEATDAMERSKAAAIKSMRERAGIESAAPAVAPSPGMGGTVPGTAEVAPPINQDQQKNLELIKNAMIKQGITDPKMIAATLGNVMKESGGKTQDENLNYKNTSNDRIRSIFKSATKGKSDAEINEMKSSPEKMAEANYGAGTKLGTGMGNTEVGDGWKYRGRGFIQLTGKSNYSAASKSIFGDDRLVKNPDMANDPAVAAEISAWFMKRGSTGMAKRMGIDRNNMTQDQANALATSTIAGTNVVTAGGYLGVETLSKVNKFAGSSQIAAIAGSPATPQLSQQEKFLAENRSKLSAEQQAQLDAKTKTDTATAAAKPTSPRVTVPASSSAVVAATTAPSATVAAVDTVAAEKDAKEKDAKEKATQTQTATPPAGTTMQDVIASLNTNIALLTQLQAKAVSIAEQQLRATNSLSRDAYKAV